MGTMTRLVQKLEEADASASPLTITSDAIDTQSATARDVASQFIDERVEARGDERVEEPNSTEPIDTTPALAEARFAADVPDAAVQEFTTAESVDSVEEPATAICDSGVADEPLAEDSETIDRGADATAETAPCQDEVDALPSIEPDTLAHVEDAAAESADDALSSREFGVEPTAVDSTPLDDAPASHFETLPNQDAAATFDTSVAGSEPETTADDAEFGADANSESHDDPEAATISDDAADPSDNAQTEPFDDSSLSVESSTEQVVNEAPVETSLAETTTSSDGFDAESPSEAQHESVANEVLDSQQFEDAEAMLSAESPVATLDHAPEPAFEGSRIEESAGFESASMAADGGIGSSVASALESESRVDDFNAIEAESTDASAEFEPDESVGSTQSRHSSIFNRSTLNPTSPRFAPERATPPNVTPPPAYGVVEPKPAAAHESVARAECDAPFARGPRCVLSAAKADPSVVALRQPFSRVAEQIRSAATRLTSMNTGGAPLALAVTSAAKREGKSTFCANLGLLLSEGGHRRVIVVDGDLRNGTIAPLLGAKGDLGLADVLRGELEISAVVQATSNDGFFVVGPGRTNGRSPAELLSGPALAETIARLRKHADYVLIDTPATSVGADATLIARAADGALMVVAAGRTPAADVEVASSTLRGNNVRIVGAIMTSCNDRSTLRERRP